MQDLEQTIRERAYQLWAEAGHQDGHAEAHWLAAQRELLSASLSGIGRLAVGDAPAKPKAKGSQKKRRAA